jgi:hypothetical protein
MGTASRRAETSGSSLPRRPAAAGVAYPGELPRERPLPASHGARSAPRRAAAQSCLVPASEGVPGELRPSPAPSKVSSSARMASSVATSPNAARCCTPPPAPANHGLLPLACLRLQAMSTAVVAYGELETLAREKLRSDPAAGEHVWQHQP